MVIFTRINAFKKKINKLKLISDIQKCHLNANFVQGHLAPDLHIVNMLVIVYHLTNRVAKNQATLMICH